MKPTVNKKELYSTLIIYLSEDLKALGEAKLHATTNEERQALKQEMNNIDEYITNLHILFIEEAKKGD